MINTKPVPIIITLAAAFISCVISIAQKVEFSEFVKRLAIVVAIFLVMGTIIKMILDYAFKTLEPITPIDEDVISVSTPLDEAEGQEGQEESSEESQEPDEA
ncbi:MULTISPECIES: hypothetical protein [Pseudobutyrivibrio]|jgi:uncharacterized membrane protein|uniref:Uncharacterized protein n=2 Tax=Pseudobutyrivibrio TaxID=46205 RepID=A0A2G3E9V7_9FIRM|nr:MULTISPECIES: hypothetical protein [Pseudobutyrivibrio]MBQ7470588.1 hypothetical protein [Pseudobutyrivibrio sp.]NEX01008.1 hypothetical protein [Pseudobutyrivibrio xylanivorans]PHU40017.1 hypothetical protein CSX00_08930 [Pseudobutyrivibrio ruminis]SFR64374.1 hypothetical protein SAMN04487829_0590 [Pseudobutyrivibrio sp. NOR37]